jgi:KDO2-lipid IV(A) lauroyltransferase
MRLRGEKLLSLFASRGGSRIMEQVLAKGCGAIIISPHLGNWELCGFGMAEAGSPPINVLTYREVDEKVNELREKGRRERGINFIYVDRDEVSPLAVIGAVNALRRNELLALLGDRDGSSHTMSMEFFGREAAIPLGAAFLALASGAPVIPMFVPYEGGRYSTYVEEPIWFGGGNVSREEARRIGMEKLLRVFEKYIRAYPDQWYNFYDYWGIRDARGKKD